MRWSFGFGRFRVYGGKSAAARRAEARRKARERERHARERQAAREQREQKQRISIVSGVVTRTEPGKVMVRVKNVSRDLSVTMVAETITVLSREKFIPGEAVEVRFRAHGLTLHDLQTGISGNMTKIAPELVTSTGPARIDKVVPYEHFPNFNVYFTPQDPSCRFHEFTTLPDSIPGREHVKQGSVVEFDMQDGEVIRIRPVAD